MVNDMKIETKIIMLFFLLGISLLGNAQPKPKRDVSKDRKPLVTLGKSYTISKEGKKIITKIPPKKISSPKVAKKVIIANSNKNVRGRATYIYVNGLKTVSTTVGHVYSKVEYTVKTDGQNWIFTHVPSWCILTKTSSTSFVLFTMDNPLDDDRNDYFYVESNDEFVRINITQRAMPVDVNNVKADYTNVRLLHNSINYMQSMVIAADLYVENAKGVELVPVAFIEDNDGNSIKASNSWTSYRRPASGDVYVRGASIKPTNNGQYFEVSMVLPNNAMALPNKKNYLRCYVWLYCPATVSFVKCMSYVSFIAERNKGKVITHNY